MRVNGTLAQLGDSVDPDVDRIELDGRVIELGERVFWMLNKPRGVLSTTRDPQGRRTVLDLLPPEARAQRLYPVGRLDLETEGLVILTNDGEVAEALLHPSRGSEREYRVTVRGRLSREAVHALRDGMVLDDGPTAPAHVGRMGYDRATDCTTFALTMIEGRKRQIRRMLRALGHPVRELVRTRVGTLVLGTLGSGEARPLSASERAALQAHAERHGARPARRDVDEP